MKKHPLKIALPTLAGTAALALLSGCHAPAANVDELSNYYNRGNVTPIPHSPVLEADAIREAAPSQHYHQRPYYAPRRHGYPDY